MTSLLFVQGNVEAAFQELNKATLKPFLMRIWGQAESGEVTSGQAAPKEKGLFLYKISSCMIILFTLCFLTTMPKAFEVCTKKKPLNKG